MSDPSGAYLQIRSVSKTFGDSVVVRDFDLGVDKGEFVSLLGPSGCGKTTLLRMVSGLEFPDSGAILLDGKDITAVPTHKRPVNTVFQRVTLFPHLNVRENVEFGLRLRHVPKVEASGLVRDALELVQLPDFGERPVRTLSGGQAQRVALARALVNRPKVLLLDEPLSALDLQIRRELQVQLKEIHRELQGTFVYVTHDQEEALSMSDRVVVMDKGCIIQACAPEELYRAPGSMFVASFVGSGNVWPGTLVEHDGPVSVVSVDGVSLRGAKALRRDRGPGRDRLAFGGHPVAPRRHQRAAGRPVQDARHRCDRSLRGTGHQLQDRRGWPAPDGEPSIVGGPGRLTRGKRCRRGLASRGRSHCTGPRRLRSCGAL